MRTHLRPVSVAPPLFDQPTIASNSIGDGLLAGGVAFEMKASEDASLDLLLDFASRKLKPRRAAQAAGDRSQPRRPGRWGPEGDSG